jgi:hypothetical protein
VRESKSNEMNSTQQESNAAQDVHVQQVGIHHQRTARDFFSSEISSAMKKKIVVTDVSQSIDLKILPNFNYYKY